MNKLYRFPLGRLGVLSTLLCGAGPALSQTNAGHVLPEVDPALAAYCASDTSSACALQSEPPALRAGLAPDKFVLLSAAALAGVRRDTELVQGRLSELRGRLQDRRPVRLAALGPGRGISLLEWRGGQPPALGFAGALPATDAGGGNGFTSGFGVFVRGEGEFGRSDPTAFDPGFRQRATGFTLGADLQPTPAWVLGIAVGGRNSRSTVDTGDGARFSEVNEHGSSLSAYVSWLPAENAYVDLIAMVGRGRYDTRRDIDLTSGSDTAVGATRSRDTAVSIGGGYSILRDAWSYGPYGRVSYGRTRVDAFTERPNPSATQLSVQEQTATSLVSGLGLQASWAHSQSWGVLAPNARLEWNHQFRSDRARELVARFAGAPPSADPGADTMTLGTTPPDRNYATLDLGLAAHFGVGRSALVNYSAVLGRSNRSSQAVTVEVRLEF